MLKPSEVSPSSALKLAELAVEAGVPEGVLNVVPGLGATVGEALALHRDVDLISFTGSTGVGRKVMEASASSNNKPMLLECSGKSPNIVFNDADDLDRVADEAVRLAFWNQGQWCAAHTRLIVQHDIEGAVLEKVVSRARRLVPGNPLDESTNFGPLAGPAQRSRVKGHVEGALDAGARPVLKGRIQEAGGCFVSPTIFDRVDSHMPIVQEEIFGPVLCVQPFRTEDEAIELANVTDYALAATVWTRDVGRAKRMTRAVRANVRGEQDRVLWRSS